MGVALDLAFLNFSALLIFLLELQALRALRALSFNFSILIMQGEIEVKILLGEMLTFLFRIYT
jgi:hypothetical protein